MSAVTPKSLLKKNKIGSLARVLVDLSQTDRSCDCRPGECEATDRYVDQLQDMLRYSAPKTGVAGMFAESIQVTEGSRNRRLRKISGWRIEDRQPIGTSFIEANCFYKRKRLHIWLVDLLRYVVKVARWYTNRLNAKKWARTCLITNLTRSCVSI